MFKSGKYMAAHFAHYHAENCAAFSEGETAAHLNGKKLLHDKFSKEGLFVLLESWLPKLAQRPDLVIHPEMGNPIAVEYQCSPISFSDLKDRTEGYRNSGYHVWWICGMGYQPHLLTQKIFQFLDYSKGLGCWFSMLDSERKELQLIHHVRVNSANQTVFDKTIFPLYSLPFETLEQLYGKGEFPLSGAYSKKKQMNGEKRKYMQATEINLLRYRTDLEHKQFLLRVYLNREALHQLPSLLFEYPFQSLPFITPAYIWKYYVLEEIVAIGERSCFTKKDVLGWIGKFLSSKQIRKRETIFLKEEQDWICILTFLGRLEEQRYLTTIGENEWLVVQLPEKRKTNDLFLNLR